MHNLYKRWLTIIYLDKISIISWIVLYAYRNWSYSTYKCYFRLIFSIIKRWIKTNRLYFVWRKRTRLDGVNRLASFLSDPSRNYSFGDYKCLQRGTRVRHEKKLHTKTHFRKFNFGNSKTSILLAPRLPNGIHPLGVLLQKRL